MTFDDYQSWQPTYSKYNYNNYADDRMLEMAGVIGLAAEAGELLGIVQKAIRKDVAVDRDKIIDELGDVLWYAAQIMNTFDSGLEEVIKFNKKKLDERNAP